jgi:uncharacterized membrane protein YqaE (UPF0057 family)
MDILRIVIAILLPPLGVFLQVGVGRQFWINVLLTILGYIPGIVHAVWVITRYSWAFSPSECTPDYGVLRGRVNACAPFTYTDLAQKVGD